MLPEFDNTAIAFQYKTNAALRRAQVLFSSMGSALITTIGTHLTLWSIKLGLPIKGLIRNTIFKQFCGGETIQEAALTADNLSKYEMGIILDYSVEGKEEEEEFDKATQEFIKAIQFAATKKNIPFISVKITGFARFQLLERIHENVLLSESEKSEWKRVQQRMDDITAAAYKNNIMVLIDAEETWIQNAVNYLVDDMMEKYNKQKAIVYNTYQLYCHGSLPYLKSSFETSFSKGYILGAKLVRGAYMEKERARAKEFNYPSPIQPDKAATDKDYNEAVIFCLERLEKIAGFFGTHNEESCMIAAKYMEAHNIPHNHSHVYFSQLYGMSDNISFNLAHRGYNIAKYLPYGPVKDVIPYLMRRAQENTSVAGQTGRELSLINKELKRRKSRK